MSVRSWRQHKSSTHTREVHSERLPAEVAKVVAAMAERLVALERQQVEMMETIARQSLELVEVKAATQQIAEALLEGARKGMAA